METIQTIKGNPIVSFGKFADGEKFAVLYKDMFYHVLVDFVEIVDSPATELLKAKLFSHTLLYYKDEALVKLKEMGFFKPNKEYLKIYYEFVSLIELRVVDGGSVASILMGTGRERGCTP